MAAPRRPAVRRGAASKLRVAPALRSNETPDLALGAILGAERRSWRLWFPARLGPARKKSVTVGSVKLTRRVRTLELPPTKNTKRGNPYAHSAWIREWRTAAKNAAQVVGIPRCARIRLSAVIYRRSIGIADAENDHARLAPLQDGLVDAGVVPKDTYAFVERGDVREERAGGAGTGVLLIVEEVLT